MTVILSNFTFHNLLYFLIYVVLITAVAIQ